MGKHQKNMYLLAYNWDDFIFLIYSYIATHSYLVPLGIFGIWRWSVWLFKELVALRYRPKHNFYYSSVSIVTPVYNEDPQVFSKALISWISNQPNEIIAVVDYTNQDCIAVFKRIQRWFPQARLLITFNPGKRQALADGIKAAKGEIVALVDSDTFWSRKTMRNALSPFADPKVGGVGTYQNVWQPKTLAQKIFNMQLNLRYHDDFPFLAAAGDALICLSGRTAFYRKDIILPLLDDLVNETFMGKPVISGDDKRLTYLVLSHGFKLAFQSNSHVYTPGMPDLSSFLKQRLRWTRNSLRADLKALKEGWPFKHPALAFFQIDKVARSLAIILSPIYFIVSLATGLYLAAALIFVWWFGSRLIKLMPHLRIRPADIVLLPFFILFTFTSAIINIFALFTLNTQGWITRWDASRLLHLRFLQQLPAYAATSLSLIVMSTGVFFYKQQVYFIPQAEEYKIQQQMLSSWQDQPLPANSSKKGPQTSGANNLLVTKYTVKDGDSIAQIATEAGIDPMDLLYANFSRLPNWNKLEAGSILSIPGKDIHLKPLAYFNYQRIYPDPARISYNEQTNTIELFGRGAEFTLSAIKAQVGNKLLEENPGKRWYLKANLILHSGTTLKLSSSEVQWLKLSSNKNGFIYILTYNSIFQTDKVKITSWDENTKNYDQNLKDGRSFILAKDGSRMDFYNSEFAYLGFPRSKDMAMSSYGVSWRISNGKLNTTLLTGEVIGSKFHHNYFGAYTYGATGMLWRGNEFYENIRYGLDPHDDSNSFLVENNIARDNGSHGIIFSKRCINNIIRNNLSYNNKGHGIMLHEKSDNNLVANNTLFGNTDGVTLWRSSNNIVKNNKIYKNSKSGIRANMQSVSNTFLNNQIANNKLYGIYLYSSAGSNIIQSNQLTHNGYALYIKTDANSIQNNKVEKNRIGIFLRAGASGNQLSNNQIIYNYSFGIYVKNPIDKKNLLGPNYMRRNIQDIKTKAVIS